MSVKIRLLKPLHPKVTLWILFWGYPKQGVSGFTGGLCSILEENGVIKLFSPHAMHNSKQMCRLSLDLKKESFVAKEREIAFIFRQFKPPSRQEMVGFQGTLIVNGKEVKKWRSYVGKNMPMVEKCQGFCSPNICLSGEMDEGVSSDFLFELTEYKV